MKKLLVAVLVPLLAAGCAGSCRVHKSEDMRAMLAPANLPDESAGPLARVHFDYDSAALSNESKSTIRENLAWLKKHGNPNVELGGNCDERGTNEYNMVLGMSRADSTLSYIASLGEDAGQFTTTSYGEELPLDPAHNENAWAKNRCVEFSVK